MSHNTGNHSVPLTSQAPFTSAFGPKDGTVYSLSNTAMLKLYYQWPDSLEVMYFFKYFI